MENSTLFVLVAFLLLLVANSCKAAAVHSSAGTSTGDHFTSRLDNINGNHGEQHWAASESSHLYPSIVADAWSAIQDSTTSLYHSILAAAATAAAGGGAESTTGNVDSTTTTWKSFSDVRRENSLRGPGSFVIVHPPHRDHHAITSYQSHRTAQLELTEVHRMMQDNARLVAKQRFELEASEAKHRAELEEVKAQVAQERNKSNELARQLEEERDTRAKGESQMKAEIEKLERILKVESELRERNGLSLVWAQMALSRESEAHNETKQALEREAKEHEKARLAWRLYFVGGGRADNRTEAHYEEWLASWLAYSSSSSSSWRLPQWAVPLNLTTAIMVSLLVWNRTMHFSSAYSRGHLKPKTYLKPKKKKLRKHANKNEAIKMNNVEEDAAVQTEQEAVVAESTAAATTTNEEERETDEIKIGDVEERGAATSALEQVVIEEQASEQSYEAVAKAAEKEDDAEEKEHVEPDISRATDEIDENVINRSSTPSEVETAAAEERLLVDQQEPKMPMTSADEPQTFVLLHDQSDKKEVEGRDQRLTALSEHLEVEPEQPPQEEQEAETIIISGSINGSTNEEETDEEKEETQPSRPPRRIDQEMRLIMEDLEIPLPPAFIKNESDQVWWLEGYIEAADKYLRLIEELNEAAAAAAAARAVNESKEQKEEEQRVRPQPEQEEAVEEEKEVEEEEQKASNIDKETISCEGRPILHDDDDLENEDDQLQSTTASSSSSSSTFSSAAEATISTTSTTESVADSTSEQPSEELDRPSSCQLDQADPPGIEALEVKDDDLVDYGDDDSSGANIADEEHFMANDELHEPTTTRTVADDDETKRAFLSALFESLQHSSATEDAKRKGEFKGFASSYDDDSSSSDYASPAYDHQRQEKGKEKEDDDQHEEEEKQERKPFIYFGDEQEFRTNYTCADENHNPPSEEEANTAETEENQPDDYTTIYDDDVFREPIYRPWWYAEDHVFMPPPSAVAPIEGEVAPLTSETGALQSNARHSAFERFMALHWVLSGIKTNACPTLREPPALIMWASVSHHACVTWVVNGRVVATGELVTKEALKAALRKLMLQLHPDRHARHWWVWLADEWTREISDLYDRLQSASQVKQLYDEHHAEVSAWQNRFLQAVLEQQIQAAMERQRQRDEELDRMMREQAAAFQAEETIRPATPPEARRKVKVRRRRTAQQ